MKKCSILLALIFLVFFSCVQKKNIEINIAAASSLQPVLKELLSQFTIQTGVHVNLITGSSGKLTAQIESGAPFDIFFSADNTYTNYLQPKLKLPFSPRTFAQGALVFVTLKNFDKQDTPIKSLILNDNFKKIAIPNPKLAPYGKAAHTVLTTLGIRSKVQSKLVFAESVSQTNQFLKSNSVSAAFTSLSTAKNKDFSNDFNVYQVPKDLYNPIVNSMLIVTQKKENLFNLKKLSSFFESDKAKLILKAYGYTVSK